MPTAAPSRLPISPSRVFAGESDGASGTVPKRLPTMKAPTSAPGAAKADRGHDQDTRLASLGGECDAVREHDAEDDQADRGDPEIADRPGRVGPNDREERAGQHEPTDEQIGGLGAAQRDRDHDRQARDLEGHDVVARQVREPAPLEQGDSGDRRQEDRQRGQAAQDGDGQDPGQDRVAHRPGADDARVGRSGSAVQSNGPASTAPASPIPAITMRVAAASWVGVIGAPGPR